MYFHSRKLEKSFKTLIDQIKRYLLIKETYYNVLINQKVRIDSKVLINKKVPAEIH